MNVYQRAQGWNKLDYKGIRKCLETDDKSKTSIIIYKFNGFVKIEGS